MPSASRRTSSGLLSGERKPIRIGPCAAARQLVGLRARRSGARDLCDHVRLAQRARAAPGTIVAPFSCVGRVGQMRLGAGAALDEDLEARVDELAGDVGHERDRRSPASISFGTQTFTCADWAGPPAGTLTGLTNQSRGRPAALEPKGLASAAPSINVRICGKMGSCARARRTTPRLDWPLGADLHARRPAALLRDLRRGQPQPRAAARASCSRAGCTSRLRATLAERGHRVITLDLLGHGESDRPRDMWRYSMPIFAREVVALLDHLELDEAVVGGTVARREHDARGRIAGAVPGARHGDRDAGARQRAAGLRDRLHAAA